VQSTESDLAPGLSRDDLAEIEAQVHGRLVEEIQPSVLGAMAKERMIEQIEQMSDKVLQERSLALPVRLRARLVREVYYEVRGYGPIQPLVDDPTLTEIMVNGPKQVWAERDGKLFLTDRIFKDDAHVLRVIGRIVTPLGRRVDEASPMVDARLPDGSRVNAIIPPLAVHGPHLNIRKFSRVPYTADDLVNFGTYAQQMMAFLRACVGARLNIIVSGGTGSGKTTTLNVLSCFIPASERIVTIEDAAELRLQQDHVVSLESRPSNLEGKGEVTIRQLVRNSLRMRPDRIIVGETRGGECLDMLQAMNTGHDGSLSTAHTNSPRDTLSRLETMVLMAGTELPSRAIREQISSAINLIVHQARFRDGTRKCTHISEIQGMEGETVVLQDLFLFIQEGVDKEGNVIGYHTATGLRPKCLPRLEAQGLFLDPDAFAPLGGLQ
jgi:pilus assembly protein CpaF